MKKIKVTFPKTMTSMEADEILHKSISTKINGSSSEKFDDPATEKITNNLLKYYNTLYDELIDDIIKVLEEK